MKISIRTFALYVTGGVALTGCHQAPSADFSRQARQTNQPVQTAGACTATTASATGLEPGRTFVMLDLGCSAQPGTAQPNYLGLIPPPSLDAMEPKTVDMAMGYGPNQGNPLPIPPLLPIPAASDGNNSGSIPPFRPTPSPGGAGMSSPAPPMQSIPAQVAQNPTPSAAMQAISAQLIRAFSHSDDYRVLTGQVQSWRQTWKLRYADFGTVDPYGGSVALEGSQLDALQDGCRVRVEGRLIPATERGTSAQFQVQSLQVIGQ